MNIRWGKANQCLPGDSLQIHAFLNLLKTSIIFMPYRPRGGGTPQPLLPLLGSGGETLVHSVHPSFCWQTKPRQLQPHGFPRGHRHKSSTWCSPKTKFLLDRGSVVSACFLCCLVGSHSTPSRLDPKPIHCPSLPTHGLEKDKETAPVNLGAGLGRSALPSTIGCLLNVARGSRSVP